MLSVYIMYVIYLTNIIKYSSEFLSYCETFLETSNKFQNNKEISHNVKYDKGSYRINSSYLIKDFFLFF